MTGKAKVKVKSGGMGHNTYLYVNDEVIVPCQMSQVKLSSVNDAFDTFDVTVTIKECELDIEASNIKIISDNHPIIKELPKSLVRDL